MRDLSNDRSLLAINSVTVKAWSLPQLVEGCARAGISAIAPWRAQPSTICASVHCLRTVAVLSESSTQPQPWTASRCFMRAQASGGSASNPAASASRNSSARCNRLRADCWPPTMTKWS